MLTRSSFCHCGGMACLFESETAWALDGKPVRADRRIDRPPSAGGGDGLCRSSASLAGPMQGIHDFNHAGTAIEVKTVVGSGNWLQISRLAQLETTGLSALAVARPRIQESAI